jgi:hypothetical protein
MREPFHHCNVADLFMINASIFRRNRTQVALILMLASVGCGNATPVEGVEDVGPLYSAVHSATCRLLKRISTR